MMHGQKNIKLFGGLCFFMLTD